jgi:hypothetical protein
VKLTNSPLSSAEFKNGGPIPSLLHMSSLLSEGIASPSNTSPVNATQQVNYAVTGVGQPSDRALDPIRTEGHRHRMCFIFTYLCHHDADVMNWYNLKQRLNVVYFTYINQYHSYEAYTYWKCPIVIVTILNNLQSVKCEAVITSNKKNYPCNRPWRPIGL